MVCPDICLLIQVALVRNKARLAQRQALRVRLSPVLAI